MSLSGVFDIASSALAVNQAALDVTGNNMANVNTPDYSRQEVILKVANPASTTLGVMGRGVAVAQIKRDTDTFLGNQLQLERSNQGKATVLNETYSNVEEAFNEQKGFGMGTSVTDFFNSWQEVSTSPSTPEQRSSLITNGQLLMSKAQSTEKTLSDLSISIKQETPGILTQINNLADTISALNDKISGVEAGSTQKANDYRDQRDGALNSLAQLVNFQSYEDTSGRTTVVVGQRNLVGSPFVHPLSMVPHPDGSMSITMDNMDITNNIQGGQLEGLINLNNSNQTGVPAALSDLRRVVGSITNETNIIQSTGFGLNSQPSDFSIKDNTPVTSTTGNITSTSITNFQNFKPGDYTIHFTSPNTYNIFRNGQSFGSDVSVSLGQPVSSNVSFTSPAINFDGMNVSFGVQPQTDDTYYVAAEGKNFFNPLTPSVSSSSNSPATPSVSIFDKTALTYKEYTATFTGPNTYQLTDIKTNTTTTGTLNGNNSILVDGMEVHFSGTPNVGNTFNISPIQNAISPPLAGVTITKTDDVAAAGSPAASPGDNTNALVLNNLDQRQHAANSSMSGTSSSQYYDNLVSTVGSLASNAKTSNDFENSVIADLQQRQSAVSGVNLDEEAVNMLKYQKGYQAAAQLINVANTLLDTLIKIGSGG
ncbi:MAG: flagellar hook-associated protein FlgK [Nitrospirae bacterium]|nr:flagellar hook-associated protein FlgK [Nitrospirota bacterium]